MESGRDTTEQHDVFTESGRDTTGQHLLLLAALQDELETVRKQCARVERNLETTRRRLATQTDARQQFNALALLYEHQAMVTEDLVGAHDHMLHRYRDAFKLYRDKLSHEDSSRFFLQFQEDQRAIRDINKKLQKAKDNAQEKLEFIHLNYPSAIRERKAAKGLLLLEQQ